MQTKYEKKIVKYALRFKFHQKMKISLLLLISVSNDIIYKLELIVLIRSVRINPIKFEPVPISWYEINLKNLNVGVNKLESVIKQTIKAAAV